MFPALCAQASDLRKVFVYLKISKNQTFLAPNPIECVSRAKITASDVWSETFFRNARLKSSTWGILSFGNATRFTVLLFDILYIYMPSLSNEKKYFPFQRGGHIANLVSLHRTVQNVQSTLVFFSLAFLFQSNLIRRSTQYSQNARTYAGIQKVEHFKFACARKKHGNFGSNKEVPPMPPPCTF